MGKELGLSYFYGNMVEQFMFYRIPKLLFTDPRFSIITTDAKLLYGLMLDRMSLSAQNKWLDDEGRVYIYFSVEDICCLLSCGRDKALKLLAELDMPKGIGLIERKIRGQGKPTVIYVKDFSSNSDFLKSHIPTPKNLKETVLENEHADPQKSLSSTHSNTNLNHTEKIYTDSFILSDETEDRSRRNRNEYEAYREIICENIGYESLMTPYNREDLAEILEIMVDVVCTNRESIRVGGDDKPAAIVKSRFLKLNYQHIEFVMSCMRENTTKIRNIHSYLITALYNAPMTIGNYYTSLVSHDMSKGVI